MMRVTPLSPANLPAAPDSGVNAFPEPLEAVYIFPLPPSAAVTHFTMTAQRPPGRRHAHGALTSCAGPGTGPMRSPRLALGARRPAPR
jgi:hypothetical protein